MSDLCLVMFDVDGTLIDSEAHIAAALDAMYRAGGRATPDRQRLLSIVGLSLNEAIRNLEPDLDDRMVATWAEAYRDEFVALRKASTPSPLFPGAREVLDRLLSIDHVLMGVATGKARRGLDHLIEAHGLDRYFVTMQTADHHPSKPHPAMLEAALSETGVPPERTVMIGDTSFDIEMGREAGAATIAVTWGYHPRHRLRAVGPDAAIDSFVELDGVLDKLLGVSS